MMFTIIKIITILQIKSSLSLKSYRDEFKTVCGKQKAAIRIFGGTDTSKGEFPFFARIGKIKSNGHFNFYCGGSLITDVHVLTAVHCFENIFKKPNVNKIIVSLGTHMRKTKTDRSIYYVTKLIPYHLNASIFEDDVAILKLATKVKFTDFISPICLPDNTSPNSLIGRTAIVIGLGHIDGTSKVYPKILQKATVTIRNLSDCADVFGGPMADGQICAGNKDQDSCGGDSGGPLFKVYRVNGESRYTQLGIVSYGSLLCEDENPAIYTSTHYFLNWIDSHLNEESKVKK